MDNRRHKHRKKRGSLGRQALGVSFVNSVYQDKGYGGVFPSTDIYSYNAQRVNLDYLGNAYLLPKHYLAPEGVSYFQNEFAAQGVDWTDISIWTEASGGSLSKASATELALSSLGAGSGSGRVVSPLLFSGVDLEGRSTGAVVLVKATSEGDVGKDVVVEIVCVGATNSQSVTITLTSEYQPIYTGAMVGTSGDIGLYLRFYGAVTNTANNCTVSLPGVIEWRTGQDTSNPPMPEDIKCFVPVGPEHVTNGSFDTDSDWTAGFWSIAGGKITGSALSAGSQFFQDDADMQFPTRAGKHYVVEFTVSDFAAGGVRPGLEGTNGTTVSSNGTYRQVIVSPSGTARLFFTAIGTTTLSVDNVSVRESANGFYASEYTPANTVSGGVITRGTGTLLHPWHWERIGYSVPLKVKDQYDPFATSTALNAGNRTIATSPTTTQQIYNKVDAFPNLLPPAARVDFAGEWTQTGTGSVTPVGDGVDLARYTFDSAGGVWSTNGTATETASVTGGVLKLEWTGSGSAQVISPTLVGLSDGDWFVVNINVTENNVGSIGIFLRYNETNYQLQGTSGTGESSFLLQYAEGFSSFTVGYAGSYSGSGDFSIDDVNYQLYSYTTLSDENNTANRSLWQYETTIPTDDEHYELQITISRDSGQSQTSTLIGHSFSGTSTEFNSWTYTWATGTLAASTTASSNVSAATQTNSDGTVTITFRAQDSSANTTQSIGIYPAHVLNEQGTVNVHGDVVLQRVSAAAEPAWNTLRPGDEVEQLNLQVDDFDTSWANNNSTGVSANQTDVLGNPNTAQTLSDSDASFICSLNQDHTVTPDADKYAVQWGFIKKNASPNAYPGVGLTELTGGTNLSQYTIDPANGGMTARSIGAFVAADVAFTLDGAVIETLLPEYVNASDYWMFCVARKNSAVSQWRNLVAPAVAETFSGSWVVGSEGDNVFDKVQFAYSESPYPYFFDSIATTSTVTEEVQDWSKIFTFLTEADGNVCNAVLGHGFYTNLGVPIEPATTQDMATAAVLATGGSASTYPTSWGEVTDADNIASVVDEGVSPIYSGARYIDIRINNTSGGNASATIRFDPNLTTGITQGDSITLSAWMQITSGAHAGATQFGIREYDSGSSFLVGTFAAVSETPSDEIDRLKATVAVSNASTDRYIPCLRFTTVPDGTDFTIRITLPNSVQQPFLSSVILGQETRTSQAGALRYDIANFSVSNTQIRTDLSLGIPQADIAAVQNIWAVNSSNANRGLRFGSNGNFGIADSAATTLQIVDWSASADEVIRSSVNFDSGSSTFSMSLYSTTLGTGFDSDAYSGSMAVDQGIAIGDVSLSYPMHVHGLWSIPNGYESSVTLTSDSERYAQ